MSVTPDDLTSEHDREELARLGAEQAAKLAAIGDGAPAEQPADLVDAAELESAIKATETVPPATAGWTAPPAAAPEPVNPSAD
jgi:hypothetical protein